MVSHICQWKKKELVIPSEKGNVSFSMRIERTEGVDLVKRTDGVCSNVGKMEIRLILLSDDSYIKDAKKNVSMPASVLSFVLSFDYSVSFL